MSENALLEDVVFGEFLGSRFWNAVMKKGVFERVDAGVLPPEPTVSEDGAEGPDELEGGGDDTSPTAVSRCAGEQKSSAHLW